MAVTTRSDRTLGMADAVGIVVALTALAVWPELPDGVNHPKMLVLTLGSLAILPFALRRQWILWRSRPGLTAQRVVLGAGIVMLLWSVVSAVTSDATWQDSVFGAWGRNAGVLTLLAVTALLLAASTFSRADIERFISWIMLLTVAEVFVGILQLLGTSPTPGFAGGGAVIGTFGNSNFAAGFFAVSSCLILSRALSRNSTAFQRWLSVVLLIALVVLMIGTQASQAIGAGLAGIVAFVVVFAIAYRGRFRRVALIGALALSAVGAVGIVASVLGLGPLARLWSDVGFTIRIEYWKGTLATFEALPVFGTGPDGLKRFFGQYRPESYVTLLGEENKLDAAHNVFLHFAATIGALGALAWIILFAGSLIVIFYRVIRGPVASPALAAAVTASLLAYVVQGMVSIDMLPLITIGWTLAGLAVAYSSRDVSGDSSTPMSDEPVRARRRPRSSITRDQAFPERSRSDWSLSLAALMAIALTLISGFLLVDYMRVASATDGSLDPDEALVALVDPMTTCQARSAIAQVVLATLEPEGVIDTIEESTAIDPRCGFMIHYQSELAINTGDDELANASTLQGIEFDPLLPVSWVLRGLFLAGQGEPDAARQALAEAERTAALSPTEGTSETQVAYLRDLIAAQTAGSP